jgi:hypothetical protein
MAIQLGGNLLRRFACPAFYDHLGMKLPIGRRMVTPGQLAHLVFFSFFLRRSGIDLFWHGSAPLSITLSSF